MRIKMMKTKESLFAAIEANVAENKKRSEEEKIKIFLDYLKNLVCDGVFGDTEIKCGISGDRNRIVFSDGDVIKDEHNNEIIQIMYAILLTDLSVDIAIDEARKFFAIYNPEIQYFPSKYYNDSRIIFTISKD
jgi:hypothetical protein